VFGCGEDSEKRYAGLEVAQVSPEDGPGYRLRYLHPPWDGVPDDPLATDEVSAVPFGASSDCSAKSAMCLAVEPKTNTVLEIDRPAIMPDDPDTFTYPKYRAEASVVRCPAGTLASKDVCADYLANADATGRDTEVGDDVFSGPEDGENDFKQHFREFNAKNRESLRYRRIAYFATSDREIAVRLFLEANPSLKDEEVTRMIHAFEVVEPEEQP
jgi:hypothetical protein